MGVNGRLGSRECWQTYLASWDLTPKLNASKITIIKVKTIIIINTKKFLKLLWTIYKAFEVTVFMRAIIAQIVKTTKFLQNISGLRTIWDSCILISEAVYLSVLMWSVVLIGISIVMVTVLMMVMRLLSSPHDELVWRQPGLNASNTVASLNSYNLRWKWKSYTEIKQREWNTQNETKKNSFFCTLSSKQQ